MKTTLEITDSLWHQALPIASRERVPMASLIEEGLRWVVAERRVQDSPFKLRDASVGAGGLTPEFENATPGQWRDAMYEDWK